MKQSIKGFTIVELLIVIVVIAILAAISIVAYNGIQARANSVAVQNDLSMLSKRFELFYIDNDRYPNSVSDLESLKVSLSKSAYLTDATDIYSNVIGCISSDGKDYTIAAVTVNGVRLFISKGKSVTEYTGSTSWLGSTSYMSMCSSTLSGSTNISQGAGWRSSVGGWQPWAG